MLPPTRTARTDFDNPQTLPAPGAAPDAQRLRPPQFRRLMSFEDAGGLDTCNIIAMEV